MLIPTSALPAFTVIHVAISLVAIASGFVVLGGMMMSRQLARWTALFLVTTALASVTGFGFPIRGMTPAIAIGIVSLVVLGATIFARYTGSATEFYRLVYIMGASLALYLNVVVLIVQSFQKLPFLHSLAPHQTELPFLLTQIVTLLAFGVAVVLAIRQFRLRNDVGHS